MKFNYAAFLKSDTRYQISKVTNCVSMDTHFGDACLIWQLAQLRVHGHALWRCLPYLATHPTACPCTRTSEILALVGNSPNCVSMDTHFGDLISEMIIVLRDRMRYLRYNLKLRPSSKSARFVTSAQFGPLCLKGLWLAGGDTTGTEVCLWRGESWRLRRRRRRSRLRRLGDGGGCDGGGVGGGNGAGDGGDAAAARLAA